MISHHTTLTHCPLCNADPSAFRTILASGGTHFSCEQVVICLDCSLVFLNPRMSLAGLGEYYLSDSFSRDFRGTAAPDEAASRYRDERAQRRWQFLQTHLNPGDRVLEVGCSSGNFLRLLANAGLQATGIDPSTGFAESAQRSGLTVHVGQFPEDLPDASQLYDAIVSFHVIEHVDDPALMVREIHARLRPDGLLLLEYPDLGLAMRRPLLTPSYFQKSHLRDFSLTTISHLLASAGFRIEHDYTESEAPYDKNRLLVARRLPHAAAVASPACDAKAFAQQLSSKLRAAGRRHRWDQAKQIPKSHLRRLKGTIRNLLRESSP